MADDGAHGAAGRARGRGNLDAAEPFYRTILSCCGDTEIGRKAKRLKAVPATDACESDTKPKSEAGN